MYKYTCGTLNLQQKGGKPISNGKNICSFPFHLFSFFSCPVQLRAVDTDKLAISLLLSTDPTFNQRRKYILYVQEV